MMSFKKMSRLMGFHGAILFKGIARLLFGTATAALFTLGIYGFASIASEGGWAAVFDFLCSVCTIFIAVMATYIMGGTCKKGAKR